MVNHARTLLLNESARAVSKVSTMFVPADFSPVPIPALCQALNVAFFQPGSSLLDRVQSTQNLCLLIHAAELEPYTLRFDSRITYAEDLPAKLLDLCRTHTETSTSINAVLGRLNRLPGALISANQLFQRASYQSDMQDLFQVWSASAEGPLRLGALLLGYIHQLDKARLGEN